MEALRSSEKSVNFYETICNFPQGTHLWVTTYEYFPRFSQFPSSYSALFPSRFLTKNSVCLYAYCFQSTQSTLCELDKRGKFVVHFIPVTPKFIPHHSEDDNFLGYNAVYFRSSTPTFQRFVLPPSSGQFHLIRPILISLPDFSRAAFSSHWW
jgi:hypothetical protein